MVNNLMGSCYVYVYSVLHITTPHTCTRGKVISHVVIVVVVIVVVVSIKISIFRDVGV